MKRGSLKRISARRVEQLISEGKSIPASSFAVAKKLGKKKRGVRSRKEYDNEGNLHGSQLQHAVYRGYQLMQKAGEISNLRAEIDYPLKAEGGLQIGLHRVDIEFFDLRKGCWQIFNVKADYKGSIDNLSIWKKKHFKKQYLSRQHPELPHVCPVRYDFYIARIIDGEVERVFRKDAELLEEMGL